MPLVLLNHHLVTLPFIFAFGACAGSFINVLAYRMPAGLSIFTPPSACPKCGHKLAWRDNIPVLGWLLLRGKCRYCAEPISVRYPLVELLCGLLFVGVYSAVYFLPTTPVPHEAGYPQELVLVGVWCFLAACLLAASLIDAEHYFIPLWLCWTPLLVGVAGQAFIAGDYLSFWPRDAVPGALGVSYGIGAITVGGVVGLVLANLAITLGWLKRSFADINPALEVEHRQWEEAAAAAERDGKPAPPPPQTMTPREIRGEIRREMAFLSIAMLPAVLAWLAVNYAPPVFEQWMALVQLRPVNGALGALFGAMIGGLLVWVVRILGTMGFGREAMGLGDVHLMLGVGACLGATASVAAFFIAPFLGIAVAIWLMLTGTRREIPYGPYLSAASLVAMVFMLPIDLYVQEQLMPGLQELARLIVGG